MKHWLGHRNIGFKFYYLITLFHYFYFKIPKLWKLDACVRNSGAWDDLLHLVFLFKIFFFVLNLIQKDLNSKNIGPSHNLELLNKFCAVPHPDLICHIYFIALLWLINKEGVVYLCHILPIYFNVILQFLDFKNLLFRCITLNQMYFHQSVMTKTM